MRADDLSISVYCDLMALFRPYAVLISKMKMTVIDDSYNHVGQIKL